MKKRGKNKEEKEESVFRKFKEKFREHTITAITAAFGFLIALTWREPISKAVDKIINEFNLQGNEILVGIITAILITILAVLALMFISRWESKKE